MCISKITEKENLFLICYFAKQKPMSKDSIYFLALYNHLFSSLLPRVQGQVIILYKLIQVPAWSVFPNSLPSLFPVYIKSDFYWKFRESWVETTEPCGLPAWASVSPSRGHFYLESLSCGFLSFLLTIVLSVNSSRWWILVTPLVYYGLPWWVLLQVLVPTNDDHPVSSAPPFCTCLPWPYIVTEDGLFMPVQAAPGKGESKHRYPAHRKNIPDLDPFTHEIFAPLLLVSGFLLDFCTHKRFGFSDFDPQHSFLDTYYI